MVKSEAYTLGNRGGGVPSPRPPPRGGGGGEPPPPAPPPSGVVRGNRRFPEAGGTDREFFSANVSWQVNFLFALLENFPPSWSYSRANEKNPRGPGNFYPKWGKNKKTPFLTSFGP